MPAPEPGLHKNISFEEYVRWDAVNQTLLTQYYLSALHAQHDALNPGEPTQSQALGTATHRAVLEPELFTSEYCKAPKISRRTTAGKEEYAAFVVENYGRITLTDNQYNACISMRDSVWTENSIAKRILSSRGVSEVSLLWMDSEFEVACKCRIDHYCEFGGLGTVVDLKTTRCAQPRVFERKSLFQYKYHMQAAWYLHGPNQMKEADRQFIYILVENTPPYAVSVARLDVGSIAQGWQDCHRAMTTHKKCIESGVFPGYPNEVHTISLPDWAIHLEE